MEFNRKIAFKCSAVSLLVFLNFNYYYEELHNQPSHVSKWFEIGNMYLGSLSLSLDKDFNTLLSSVMSKLSTFALALLSFFFIFISQICI